MRKVFLSLAVVLVFCGAAVGQIPQQFIWKITFIAESLGNSKISVQNRCRETHDFSISGRNVPFLDFAKTSVSVRGRASETVPVVVNTAGLQRRSYLGEVTLFCLTCAKEDGCSQSRDILNVTLNVVTSDQLENYKPSKEFGIDAPIAITSSASRAGAGSGVASDAEIKAILESLSGNPGADTDSRSASACGVPRFRDADTVAGKDCKNCTDKQKAVRELEARVRKQTALAEKYCLGLMQLENTTAFVEARASKAQRQLADASASGADGRVLGNLRTEAENSRKDAKVFRDKLEGARFVVDAAKTDAFAVMQELEEAVSALEACEKKNPAACK